jgi:hypothetical protein
MVTAPVSFDSGADPIGIVRGGVDCKSLFFILQTVLATTSFPLPGRRRQSKI